MKKRTTLRALRQSFRRVLPASDGRTVLVPLDFVTGLVFCFLSDTKSFSLEAIRRFFIARYEVRMSKGAFWERLSGRRLNDQLYAVLSQLMSRLALEAISGHTVLKKLNVSGIYLIDSSTVSLWDGLKDRYPGAWTTAAIKWHSCVDLLSAQVSWFELSAGSTNDHQCFPPLSSVAGKLLMFDLGYWDYGLLLKIHAAKGFFLSRVKSNSTICIEEVISGLSECWVGCQLSQLKPKRRKKQIIEVRGKVVHGKESGLFRLVGFWNPTEKKYHWYITNLAVSASILYPLYRLRWTLELVFKASKRSFNLDKRLVSNNETIIKSLVLSSVIASFASSVVMHLGSKHLTKSQALAISFQRAAHVVVQLADDFIDYIVRSTRGAFDRLMNKIKLFSPELFEKNYKHRPPSLTRVHTMLAA